MNLFKTIALAAPIALAGACAQAAVIDFGTDPNLEGTVLNGTFDFGGGITGTISTSDLGSRATGDVVLCDTSTQGSECRTNDPDLASDFTASSNSDDDLGALDFGYALILEETGGSGSGSNVDDASNGGAITFTFDRDIYLNSVTILDGNDNSPTGASIYLDDVLFDQNRGGDDNEYDIVDLGGIRVSSFTIDFAGSGAIGEFSAIVVPLPAGGVLLLSGLGLFGAFRMRQRRDAA